MPYITTAIAYPNAQPHIGHALEFVQADFLARYARLQGEPTFFVTGVDEHGLKVQQAALAEGLSPEAFVARKNEMYQELDRQLAVSYDRFIRTSDEDHVRMAQAVWERCAKRGDIYKKQYQAWYNVKEEEFLGLVDEYPDPAVFGIDSRFIEQIDEENYFFAMSRYKDQVVEFVKGGYVIPEERGREILNFIEDKGMKDISISREKEKLQWGIPVPGDDSQVMYVWFDALVNYLTAGATLEDGEIAFTHWPADLHCVGKDISRFHAIIWPAMLMSAELPLPKHLLVHGFLTSGGQKMSKSLGNVVDPLPLIGKFGSDAVRWFLLKDVPTTGDADCTVERVRDVYESDLANDLGNLVSRVQAMCTKYFDGTVRQLEPLPVLAEAADRTEAQYRTAIGRYAIHTALQAVAAFTTLCNQQIEENKPWTLAKDEAKRDELERLLSSLVYGLGRIGAWIEPAMPETSTRIKEALLGETVVAERLVLFPKFEL